MIFSHCRTVVAQLTVREPPSPDSADPIGQDAPPPVCATKAAPESPRARPLMKI